MKRKGMQGGERIMNYELRIMNEGGGSLPLAPKSSPKVLRSFPLPPLPS